MRRAIMMDMNGLHPNEGEESEDRGPEEQPSHEAMIQKYGDWTHLTRV
jgi:hypothetical protein